jgi:hypothetical protein
MQVDVEDVRQEYNEYRKELSAFLGSPQIYAKADKFLTGDRYMYIFMCFGIRPDKNEDSLAGGGYNPKATDEGRHTVERKVIVEFLNHMMIVPGGILRIHVAPPSNPNKFLTPS